MERRVFEVLPVGLCVGCLEMMVDPERGHPAISRDLGQGRQIWGVYCEHRECGAYCFTGLSDVQWVLHTPIDAAVFVGLVEKAIGYYLEVAVQGKPS